MRYVWWVCVALLTTTTFGGVDLTTEFLGPCSHECSGGLYIDAGTHRGIQIRKLYEPYRYPFSSVEPLFQKHFGSKRKTVCALGFEPNIRHKPLLRATQAAYRKLGVCIAIHTETAVWTSGGNARLTEGGSADDGFWGTRIDPSTPRSRGAVKMVDLTRVVKTLVDAFNIPPDRVVMKLDIEGAEFRVLGKLALKGVLCSIGALYIEWHGDVEHIAVFNNSLQSMLDDAGCALHLDGMDDEWYYQTDEPMPCSLFHVTPYTINSRDVPVFRERRHITEVRDAEIRRGRWAALVSWDGAESPVWIPMQRLMRAHAINDRLLGYLQWTWVRNTSELHRYVFSHIQPSLPDLRCGHHAQSDLDEDT